MQKKAILVHYLGDTQENHERLQAEYLTFEPRFKSGFSRYKSFVLISTLQKLIYHHLQITCY